jgi:hypothetical protein
LDVVWYFKSPHSRNNLAATTTTTFDLNGNYVRLGEVKNRGVLCVHIVQDESNWSLRCRNLHEIF